MKRDTRWKSFAEIFTASRDEHAVLGGHIRRVTRSVRGCGRRSVLLAGTARVRSVRRSD